MFPGCKDIVPRLVAGPVENDVFGKVGTIDVLPRLFPHVISDNGSFFNDVELALEEAGRRFFEFSGQVQVRVFRDFISACRSEVDFFHSHEAFAVCAVTSDEISLASFLRNADRVMPATSFKGRTSLPL